MGTSNFLYRNTDAIYAISLNEGEYENEEGEMEQYHDDWDFRTQDVLNMIDDRLNYTYKDYVRHVRIFWNERERKAESGCNRSFPGSILAEGEYRGSKETRETNKAASSFVIVMRSGYYEGCNLDFEVHTYIEDTCDGTGNFFDTECEGEESAEVYTTEDGWVTACTHEGYNDCKAMHEEAKAFLNKIFGEIADHKLGVFARFSNGETWYTSAT